MEENNEDIIIKRIITNGDGENKDESPSKTVRKRKPKAEAKVEEKKKEAPKPAPVSNIQTKLFAIMLFMFSILLLLALISYTPQDEANARITFNELKGLLSADSIIRLKADMARNWLGLFGAVISNWFYNGSIGFIVIFIPYFLIRWSTDVFKTGEVSNKTLRNTITFITCSVLFSGFTGAMRTLPWFADLPKEWSGAVGIFLGTLISAVIGSVGTILLFSILIILAILLGVDIKLDDAYNSVANTVKSITPVFKSGMDSTKGFVSKQYNARKDEIKTIIKTEPGEEDIVPEKTEEIIPEENPVVSDKSVIEKEPQADETKDDTPIDPRKVNVAKGPTITIKKAVLEEDTMKEAAFILRRSASGSAEYTSSHSEVPGNVENNQDTQGAVRVNLNEPSKTKLKLRKIEEDELFVSNRDDAFDDNDFNQNIDETAENPVVITPAVEPYIAPVEPVKELITDDIQDVMAIKSRTINPVESVEEIEYFKVDDQPSSAHDIISAKINAPVDREFAGNENAIKPLNSGIESRIIPTPPLAVEPGIPSDIKKPQLVVTVEEFSEAPANWNSPLGSWIHDEEIKFTPPDLSLLDAAAEEGKVDDEELRMNARILQEKLETFKIFIEDLSVTPGPVVTQYEFVPAAGIKISRIESLSDDLAMALKAKGIRIIAPIPGKGTIGVEIPNMNPSLVRFSNLVNTAKFQSSELALPIALGKTISGEVLIADLAKMPHLLIAGSTGSGKSVGVNTIITSLLYRKHPKDLKFVIVDPKKVELQQYSRLRHHFLALSPDIDDAIITNPQDAVSILKSVVVEMENRYTILSKVGQRNIAEYNAKVKNGILKANKDFDHREMPYIVVIIDELADLMLTAGRDVEEPIIRLAQMARAVGIHLIIATQRPSVDVITGIIKANFPARIAYLVASKIDSRTILDGSGAEQLLGNGDMLFLPSGTPKPIRIQNSFISTDEVENICNHIGKQDGYAQPYLLPSVLEKKNGATGYEVEDRDALFEDAAKLVIQLQQASVSLVQRRLKVGYARAGRIIDELEAAGIVGPHEGSKMRLVLYDSEAQLERIL